MEDSEEFQLPVWRANLAVLTREVGAVTRLARMMTFSASYLKLMLSGQREFSEEFVRAAESLIRFRACVNKLNDSYINASSSPRVKKLTMVVSGRLPGMASTRWMLWACSGQRSAA